MCVELNIHPIYAESAQAKGRIERTWGTFQDRLVAELQLYKITTMVEANRYVKEGTQTAPCERFTVARILY